MSWQSLSDGCKLKLFLFPETVIPSILSTAGDVPIIICLRKNVDRAISASMNLVRDGRETLSFMEAMIESYEGQTFI